MPISIRRILPAALVFVTVACRGTFEPDPVGPVDPPPPPPAGPTLPFIAGSFGADYATATATAPAGLVVVAGYFGGTVDFDPESGTAFRVALGGADISVATYGQDGRFFWASRFGGQGVDAANDVAVGPIGSIYLTGYLGGGGADCNGRGVVPFGARDIVVARFDADGRCLWAHGIGSPGDDEGRAIAVDAAGNVVVAGTFSGTVDFDPGSGSAVLVSRGGTDAFVARYAPTGGFLGVVQGGGLEHDAAVALAIGEDGDIAVGGEFRGTATFGSTLSPLTLQSAGDADFWVARLAPSLALQWAVRGGGTGADQLGTRGLLFEAGGTVVAAGMFSGTADLDPGPGNGSVTSQGGADVFLTRYGIGGAYIGFARRFGGPGSDGVTSLRAGFGGQFVLTGWFQGTTDFDPGAANLFRTSLGTAGAADGYVLALTPNGDAIWVNTIGGAIAGDANVSIAAAAALTPDDAVMVVGRLFGQVDFDNGPGAVVVQGLGGGEQYLVRYERATGVMRR